MNFFKVGYALLCLVVPLAWGLLIVWASARIERFLTRRKSPQASPDETSLPPIDYHI